MVLGFLTGIKPGMEQELLPTSTEHSAISSSLADMEAFQQHVAQMTVELKRVQQQQRVDREAAKSEQAEVEARWLQRLRCARIESSMRSGFAALDLRAQGRSLKAWVEAVGAMRREETEKREEREARLKMRLRDSGREELLRERTSLSKQASDSALAAQQLRIALSARSQELERIMVRDTMTVEMWAADAMRMKAALEHAGRQRQQTSEAASAQADALKAELQAARTHSDERARAREAAVAASLGAELRGGEAALRVRAANQAIVVRLAVEQSTLHRYWKAWAVVASLLLREAGGALLQLELSKQQQRGVHTRLQAELSAEVAVARVENIEARTLLAKASVLEHLRPTHELVTDKEMLREQSKALEAAHASAAAAHAAAAAHRVGEDAMALEIRAAEGEAVVRARAPSSPPKVHQREVDFLRHQEEALSTALRRAGCEMRVLARSLQSLEVESAASLARPAQKLPPAGAPSTAQPRKQSPTPRPTAAAPKGTSGSPAAKAGARPPRPRK